MSTAPELSTIITILKKHLPNGYHAVLFGSRATGEARYNSDWDIGISGPEAVQGNTLELIREDLEELPTLHSFDVVDLNTASEFFRQMALKKTIRLL